MCNTDTLFKISLKCLILDDLWNQDLNTWGDFLCMSAECLNLPIALTDYNPFLLMTTACAPNHLWARRRKCICNVNLQSVSIEIPWSLQICVVYCASVEITQVTSILICLHEGIEPEKLLRVNCFRGSWLVF